LHPAKLIGVIATTEKNPSGVKAFKAKNSPFCFKDPEKNSQRSAIN
jgi:hypothetical protein